MKFIRIILGLAMCAGVSVRSAPATIDGVQAVVSADVVTYSEVEDYSRPAAESLRRQYGYQPEVYRQKLVAAVNDSLQQLVERQIILHSFVVEGYKLPDSVIDDVVQERIREKYGDRVTFMKKLQEQGMTVEGFRKQVRDQYIESALRNQNGQRDVFISPYKVENYYLAHQDEFRLEDQVKLRMIVLTKASAGDTNGLSLAREIQDRIKAGTPFIEMATVYSQGSQQHQGGDWGWVARPVLLKELSDVAFSLPVNQVSDVIDTPGAYYLMLVEDKKTTHVRPLSEVAVEIEKTLRLQQQSRMQKQWINGLKKKTFVRYFTSAQ
jgi:peptidyl-prolyl cis-trans isomerase SurA